MANYKRYRILKLPSEQYFRFSESVTYTQITTFTHKWSIKNFPIIPSDMEYIYSPNFSPPFLKDEWYISLRLKEMGKENDAEHIGVYLFLDSCEDEHKEQVRAKYVISVLDVKGDKRFTHQCSETEGTIFKADGGGQGCALLAPRRVLLNTAEGILGTEETLQIWCEISVFGEMKSRLLPNLATVLYTTKEMAVGCLSYDVSALLDSQEATDTIVETKDGVQIKVHKFILKMRSKVFEAMFEHDMAEKAEKKILITDFETRVIKEMINFIYTDKITDIGDIAGDLLMAADKYVLPKLKKICEKYLAANSIRSDTSANLLTLSDSCNCPKLKDKVIEFITRNAPEVCETDGWKEQLDKRPYLYKEVLEVLAKKQRTK